ncbi:hypothetical protein BDV23DRAFT_167103 [Aspergillus alliaceus]|uniref:Uncharacterized protein n=1 Tax=Petromyces alliaceus TaxID=209559 RepID=A0A5N7BRS4_PETAA|nr:hypothetical protein BDV23DRAFT_167103 [Aspergillus alliaceus]
MTPRILSITEVKLAPCLLLEGQSASEILYISSQGLLPGRGSHCLIITQINS